MNGKWLLWVKRTHLFLSVFFTPLLLLFILTGWWQTVTSSDDREKDGGTIHTLMQNLSSVHTDSQYPRPGVHHGEWMMKILVVVMCLALILSILLGLFLAWKTMKSKWLVVLAFLLGIAVPVLVLYLG